jgi:carboxyl-terminal processing protease
MKATRVFVLVTVIGLSFASGGWLLQRRAEGSASIYGQASLFDDVLSHVADYYVDSLGTAELYRLAVDGLLSQLGDPYSTFLERSDYDRLSESTTGNYGGLGIQIDVRDGWITVVAPLPDTPAERAGIQPGDRIVQLDGGSTRDWNADRAVGELRGEPGTSVTITVARIGVREPIELTIERAEIHVRSVQVAMLAAERVGYVSLTHVSTDSRDELRDEVERLRQAGMRSLVLDLRNNPGGLLDEGVDVADLFLDPGQEIVSVRGRAPRISKAYRDGERQAWPDLPIVVLVNGYSASAAEIVAGALQDHDRALVLGTPTFGKGLVQSVFKLGGDEWLKLTTARWYTPSGRTIQVARGPDGEAVRAHAGRDSGVLALPDSFRTAAGRALAGNGGIVPDTVVQPNTLTEAEQEFIQALGADLGTYQDVLASYAIELAEQRVVRPDFVPTGAMRREVHSRLQSRGVEVGADAFARAGKWVDRNLTYQAVRFAHGREAEFRRRMRDDAQVQVAIRLAASARSPHDLLGLSPPQ